MCWGASVDAPFTDAGSTRDAYTMYVAPRRDGPPLALVAARSISSLACVAAASGIAARIAARAAAATDALVSVRARRFKRRDWNYLHKPDGSASDSDSDGSVESAGDVVGSSSSDSEDDGEDEDEDEVEVEEASEDADADVERRDAAKADIRARYDHAESQIASVLSGASDGKLNVAAKCRACPGTLLLSAAALTTHAASKKHVKNLKRLGKHGDDGYVCFYPAVQEDDGVVSDGDAETHAERLARLRAQKILKAEQGGGGAKGGKFSLDQFDDSDDDDDDDDDGSDSDAMTRRAAKKTLIKEIEAKKQSKTAEKRSRRHAQSKRLKSATKKKSKPGKRQRQAMKAGGAAE